MSCSNDISCPPGVSSFLSNFTFTQNEGDPWNPASLNERDSLVEQEQHVTVASCSKFVLLSNGTRGGTRIDGGRMTDEKECPKVLETPSPTATAYQTKKTISLALPIMSPPTRPKPELVEVSHGSKRRITRNISFLALLISILILIPGSHASPSRNYPDNLHQRVQLRVRDVSDKVSNFAGDFSADLAEKANSLGQDGQSFAQNLVSEIVSSVCDAYFSGDDPESFAPELLKNCVKRVYGGETLPQAAGQFFAVFGASLLCDYVVSEAYPVAQDFFPDACEGLQDLMKKKAAKIANVIPGGDDNLDLPPSIPTQKPHTRPLKESPQLPDSNVQPSHTFSLSSPLEGSVMVGLPPTSVPAVDVIVPFSDFQSPKHFDILPVASETLGSLGNNPQDKNPATTASYATLTSLSLIPTGSDTLLDTPATDHPSGTAGSPPILKSTLLEIGFSLDESKISATVVVPLATIKPTLHYSTPSLLVSYSFSNTRDTFPTDSASAIPATSFDISQSLLPASAFKDALWEGHTTRALAMNSPAGIESPPVVSPTVTPTNQKASLPAPVSADILREPTTKFDRPHVSKPSLEVETVASSVSKPALMAALSKTEMEMQNPSIHRSVSAGSSAGSSASDLPLIMASTMPSSFGIQSLLQQGPVPSSPSGSGGPSNASAELEPPSLPTARNSAIVTKETESALLSSATSRDASIRTQSDQSTTTSWSAVTPRMSMKTPSVLPISNGTRTPSPVPSPTPSSTIQNTPTEASPMHFEATSQTPPPPAIPSPSSSVAPNASASSTRNPPSSLLPSTRHHDTSSMTPPTLPQPSPTTHQAFPLSSLPLLTPKYTSTTLSSTTPLCPSAFPATCAGACVNTRTSNFHCGACWRMCELGAQCARGTCVARSTTATATVMTMPPITTENDARPGGFANFIWKGLGGVVGGE